MKTLGQLLLGIAILVIAGFIYQPFGGVLLVSIICTGGIGLLVWLPLAYLLGLLFLSLFETAALDLNASQDQTTCTPWGRAVMQFIRRARENGANEDVIRMQLRGQGWSDHFISKCLDSRDNG